MLVEGPVEPTKIEVEDNSESVQDIGTGKNSAQQKRKNSSKKFKMGTDTSPFGLNNRDPNNLNPHIQVMWDDIVGEPEGLRTPDTCWNCSIKCYDGSRRCCYVFLVVLFAPIIACMNGCQFACLAFNQVWCAGPCLRLWKINLATCKRFWEALLIAICGPCVNVLGQYCSKIKVRYQKLPDGIDRDEDDFFNV